MFVIPVYASLLGLLFIKLSFNVINARRQARIAVGDGGNPQLQRTIAVHSNFAQYVPIALLLLTFCEMQQAPSLFIHLLAAALLISRVLHAHGVSKANEDFKFRKAAMVTTFGVIGVSALYLLISPVYFMLR